MIGWYTTKITKTYKVGRCRNSAELASSQIEDFRTRTNSRVRTSRIFELGPNREFADRGCPNSDELATSQIKNFRTRPKSRVRRSRISELGHTLIFRHLSLSLKKFVINWLLNNPSYNLFISSWRRVPYVKHISVQPRHFQITCKFQHKSVRICNQFCPRDPKDFIECGVASNPSVSFFAPSSKIWYFKKRT